ncbi:hypothetical protein [Brevibacterium sp. UCMA 11754]|uniref:hypothetical protein n=1 Tax=Brevibacterium sp. UCMA 11754 TaxID=2749198 RepID=UPI001F3B6C4E|nr:hypothetical protein [Brevibacterium sp. UCMA 11754]
MSDTGRTLYPDFAAELTAVSGHDLGHSSTETLVCAGDRSDLVSLRELMNLQSSAGFDVSSSRIRARDLEPSLAPGGAVPSRYPEIIRSIPAGSPVH